MGQKGELGGIEYLGGVCRVLPLLTGEGLCCKVNLVLKFSTKE